jgi:phage tail-like protein
MMYPTAAFQFRVRIAGQGDQDAAFAEVSGLGLEMETEAFREGGVNTYVHNLPKGMSHPRLSLRRGVAPGGGSLVKWCRDTLENGLAKRIVPQDVQVELIDEKGGALCSWTLRNAFPVNWQFDPFVADQSKAAIEKIELSYGEMVRMI